jgi:putative flavoprotein involved in K+ transport
VTAVEPAPDGYLVTTENDVFHAANVVIATGSLQMPKLPPSSGKLPSDIVQLHSSQYRNPDALPAGAVLVVGSGQSGCQIVEDLHRSGRKVYLSVGSAGRLPRRYRGRDVMWWLYRTGFVDRTVDQLPSPQARFAGNPHVTGARGGHTINLHQFARDGVVLLGHLRDVQGDKAIFAPDLKENLAKADRFAAEILKSIDAYVARQGIDAPLDPQDELRDGFEADERLELDLRAEGITSVIWACGFGFDYHWVKLPVLDEFGFPVQNRGVTAFPGLYFLGMHWLHSFKSALLVGVGEDAAYIADAIAARQR